MSAASKIRAEELFCEVTSKRQHTVGLRRVPRSGPQTRACFRFRCSPTSFWVRGPECGERVPQPHLLPPEARPCCQLTGHYPRCHQLPQRTGLPTTPPTPRLLWAAVNCPVMPGAPALPEPAPQGFSGYWPPHLKRRAQEWSRAPISRWLISGLVLLCHPCPGSGVPPSSSSPGTRG